MKIVSFYAPRPEHPLALHDYLDCLRLQRASCERFGCGHLVITDAAVLADFATFHVKLPDALMPAVLAGQLAYLKSAAFDADTLLTDADTLLGRDPRSVFDGTFDLAVTTHPFNDCILNNGAIFVPVWAKAAAVAIWERALAGCGEAWGEDQASLARVLRASTEYGLHERSGAWVKFLPCLLYNWAPESAGEPVDAVVVHFRGPRKRWMAEWARRHAT